MGSKIVSVAYEVPEQRLTNQDIAQRIDTSDEWIVKNTGIRERRIAHKDQKTSDLAAAAALKALKKFAFDPQKLDCLIVATATPDFFGFPSTACLVQEKIGALNAAAFDISAACSGFVYGIELAHSLLQTMYHSVLVIGAETLSRGLDWTDRRTCILFGDAAGAALIIRCEKEYILRSYLTADGKGAAHLTYAKRERESNTNSFIQMNGREVYNYAIKTCLQVIPRVLQENNLNLDQIDWIVPHQANARIIESVAKKLSIDTSKIFMNMNIFANTSAASIPLALAQMDEEGLLKKGQIILTLGFGAGFTSGANIFIW